MKTIKHKRPAGILGCLLALSLIFSLAAPVLAVPPIPHNFWGQVTIDSVPAGEGTIISAEIGGAEYASTTVDALGRYGYTPGAGGTGIFTVPADDPDTPEKEGGVNGETIEFYVAGALATTSVFQNGGMYPLDLIVGEVPPSTLAAEAGTSYSGEAGASIALTGSATGGTAPYTYAWDLDNDGTYETPGKDVSHSWSTAGTFTIGLQVTDSDSDTAIDTATVTVTAVGADPWVYDTNNDNVMSKPETLAAITDYIADTISMPDVLAVVILYFSS